MIEEIFIKSEATYDDEGQSLGNLKTLNFIYGANASGKTTIGRIAANPERYSDCKIRWRKGVPIDCLVYNTDFVADNFSSQMPGIFTLGAKDAAILSAIEQSRQTVSKVQDEIVARKLALRGADGNGGKQAELIAAKREFEEHAWLAKTKHDEDFQEAFSGVRNSKVRFSDKLFEEYRKGEGSLCELADLRARASVVFQPGLNREPLISPLQFKDLVDQEKKAVLSRKIVGKGDVDIAAMIKRLGNSDWVKEGRAYFAANDSTCPFCQQKTDAAFEKSLSEYFDDAYLNDISEIEAIAAAYSAYSTAVLSQLQRIIETNPRYLDIVDLEQKKRLLDTKIALNIRSIAQKKSEPSTPMKLEPLENLLDAIAKTIADANSKTADHNTTFDNLAAQKSALAADIWRFVAEDTKVPLSVFEKKKTDTDAAISGLTNGIAAKEAERLEKLTALRALERQVTSVQPTVTEINNLLSSFGFRAFKLQTVSGQEHLYEIVRPNGRDASQTLSEGEKTFLTFLYFYFLLQGSISESGTTSDRVVIFDDPVSSLDSDVLFIVSSLIRRLSQAARGGDKSIKQVFVLTHNIYFHKEVSFDQKRGAQLRNDETFWIVKKEGDKSIIQGFDHNPVKTSYELLWLEVRSESPSPLTIQNTLRRILESYFKILGNMDRDAIIGKFEGQEQTICGALFSWVNDGSHNTYDDLYVACDAANLPLYLTVFKAIFEKTNQLAHYDMMMGTNAAPNPGN